MIGTKTASSNKWGLVCTYNVLEIDIRFGKWNLKTHIMKQVNRTWKHSVTLKFPRNLMHKTETYSCILPSVSIEIHNKIYTKNTKSLSLDCACMCIQSYKLHWVSYLKFCASKKKLLNFSEGLRESVRRPQVWLGWLRNY